MEVTFILLGGGARHDCWQLHFVVGQSMCQRPSFASSAGNLCTCGFLVRVPRWCGSDHTTTVCSRTRVSRVRLVNSQLVSVTEILPHRIRFDMRMREVKSAGHFVRGIGAPTLGLALGLTHGTIPNALPSAIFNTDNELPCQQTTFPPRPSSQYPISITSATQAMATSSAPAWSSALRIPAKPPPKASEK